MDLVACEVLSGKGSKDAGKSRLYGAFTLCEVLLFLHLSEKLRQRLLPAIMLLVLIAELAVQNMPSLYDRDFLTKEGFAHNFYNDGTQDASAKIRTEDESLYRICTGLDYDIANEGLVDGHNSVSVYSNTNAASLVSLTRAANVYQKSSNFFIVGYPQYYLYTLLGGKYLITDEPDFFADTYEESLFKKVDETGTNRTFENVNALPFGYVYENELNGAAFSALDGIDRMRALTTGYVRTEEILPKEFLLFGLCNLCLPGLLFLPLGFIYESGHHVADSRRKFKIINGSVWILIPDIDVVKEDLGVHGQRNSTA